MSNSAPALTPAHLTNILTSALPNLTHITIQDISGGCGTSFTATLVSPAFAKKTTLARHRLVNGMVKEEVSRIHAWTVRCYTPEEWEEVGREREREKENEEEGPG